MVTGMKNVVLDVNEKQFKILKDLWVLVGNPRISEFESIESTVKSVIQSAVKSMNLNKILGFPLNLQSFVSFQHGNISKDHWPRK